METVNFQCGHCRQLLAVSKQHLGQQVRCPHCQQVVVAPESAPPPPPPPVPAPPLSESLDSPFGFNQPPREETDSIFSAPPESDDLFGAAPSAHVEMPATEATQLPNLELPASPRAAVGPDDATLTFVPGRAPTLEAVEDLPHAQPLAESTEPAAFPFAGAEGTAEGGDGDLASAFTPIRPRVSRGWHIALFVIPLISYSVLATVAVGVLFFRLKEKEAQSHPLEMVPDIDGDHPTNRKGADWRGEVRFPSRSMELPAKLKVALGQTLRLGELEVTPETVERGPIGIKEEGKKGIETPPGQALKLSLKLKNVSKDLAFFPLDNYFTRAWRAGSIKHQGLHTTFEPYTQLVIAGQRFYGGPAAWNLPGSTAPHESVVGTDYNTLLQPGAEMTTFVCTDPEDSSDIDRQLARHKGETLLWRVQVRRGSMEVKGRRIPVCAVFGVEFTDKQITNSK